MLEIEILTKLKYCSQTLYFVEMSSVFRRKFTQRVDTSAKTRCIGLEKDKNNTCNKRLWTGYETDQNAGLLWKLESLKCCQESLSTCSFLSCKSSAVSVSAVSELAVVVTLSCFSSALVVIINKVWPVTRKLLSGKCNDDKCQLSRGSKYPGFENLECHCACSKILDCNINRQCLFYVWSLQYRQLRRWPRCRLWR